MFCVNCCRLILNHWDCATPHLARPWCMRAQERCQLHPAHGTHIQKHTILWATLFHAVTTGTGMVVPYQCQPESEPQTVVHCWLIILSRNKERRRKKKCTRYFIDPQHTVLRRDLQNCLISKLTNLHERQNLKARKSLKTIVKPVWTNHSPSRKSGLHGFLLKLLDFTHENLPNNSKCDCILSQILQGTSPYPLSVV